jgi:hypothetical protein
MICIMLVGIRPLQEFADDHPLPLTDPFECRIPHATDDGQPRWGHAVLFRKEVMAGDHLRDFAGLVAIQHQDHTDGCATPIRVDLTNIADEDDLVMVPWNAHETPSLDRHRAEPLVAGAQ